MSHISLSLSHTHTQQSKPTDICPRFLSTPSQSYPLEMCVCTKEIWPSFVFRWTFNRGSKSVKVCVCCWEEEQKTKTTGGERNWILTCCQPQRVTSVWSDSFTSKCTYILHPFSSQTETKKHTQKTASLHIYSNSSFNAQSQSVEAYAVERQLLSPAKKGVTEACALCTRV